ncbi:hypothetical protein QTP88_009158 [Uroleucon formosanum]
MIKSPSTHRIPMRMGKISEANTCKCIVLPMLNPAYFVTTRGKQHNPPPAIATRSSVFPNQVPLHLTPAKIRTGQWEHWERLSEELWSAVRTGRRRSRHVIILWWAVSPIFITNIQ